MRKFILFMAAFVALLLTTAVVVPMLFRERIIEQVKSQTNSMLRARLDFEHLDISVLRHFPNASLELKSLTLVGVDRFDRDTIASVERISIVVDLWSLFGDHGFEVSKLFVTRPSIDAHRLADGAVNWDVIRDLEPEQVAVVDSTVAPVVAATPFRLQLRDVRIVDASLRLRDDSTGLHSVVNPLSLRLRGDMSALQSELDVVMTAGGIGVVSGGMTLLSGAEAAVDARIAADFGKKRFRFTKNSLTLNAIRLGVDGWVELREQSLAMDLKASCEQVHFKDLLSLIPAFYMRDYHNLSATGELSMSLWVRGEKRRSSIPAFELKLGVKQGGFRYSSLLKEVTDVNIVASVANPGGAMDRTVVEISTFGMRMGSNSLMASLHATNFISDPTFRVSARGKLDLGQIKDVYPLSEGVNFDGFVAADFKASGRMSDIDNHLYEQMAASGTFVVEQMGATIKGLPKIHIRRAAATITPLAMTLGEFGVSVGQSDLSANGQLTNYLGALLRGDILSGRLYVKSDLLDLNELLSKGVDLPISTKSATSDTPQSSSPTQSSELVAPEVPQNLNLELVADVKKILFGELIINNLAGQVKVVDSNLSLSGLSLLLLDGSAHVSGSYSTKNGAANPHFKLNASLSNASFAKSFDQLDMVRKFVPLFDKTGGDYSLSLDLTTPLNGDLSPDLKALNASGELRSANIRLQNIKAFDAMAKVLSNDALRKLEVRDLTIPFLISDGRIETKPFGFKIGGYDMLMEGSTGLDQTIDYKALVTIPVSAQSVVGEKINITIGGSFDDPKINLGLKEVVEQKLKDVVGKQVEKITGGRSVDEALKQEFEQLRQKAKASAEKLIEEAKVQSDKLIASAEKKGAIAKIAAKIAADKLVAEAESQAAKIKSEIERKIEEIAAKAEAAK